MGLDIYFQKVARKEIGYFRKVNFLVKFFEDTCDYDVASQDDLILNKDVVEDLLDRCNKVLDKPSLAEELLPTCSGFFFGSTDYDDSYYLSVTRVKKYIEEKLLSQFDTLGEDSYIVFNIWY